MALVKNKDSKIELKFAATLKANGLRYKQHLSSLPGKPDFVFPRKKAVVFVDSCFWHGCRYHFIAPRSNRRFWKDKIDGNKNRDREVNKQYKEMGWTAVRLWEHSLKDRIPSNKLISALNEIKNR